MAQADFPVRVSSQSTTFRQTITGPPAVGPVSVVSETFSTAGLPRTFLYFNQTTAGAAGAVTVEFAYRMDATGLQPEWLLLSNNNALTPGGMNPVTFTLVTGAVFWRFTVTLLTGEIVEIAAASFL
jgi:hypothetical protein